MYMKFSCSAYTRSQVQYIFTASKSFNKIYQLAGRRRERSCTTLGGLLLLSPEILGAFVLLRLLAGLLLRLLSGLLLFFLESSFFLLALIYQPSAWLSFLSCCSSFSAIAKFFPNF
jgi:hypothetical protein